jgi:diguanylate cyclase (GGDEF)-like protein/PAS domain S-box-containing protein
MADEGLVRTYLRRLRDLFGQLSRLRAEREALQQRISKLELVFRNSIDVLLLVNPSNGIIEKASEAARTKLGYPPEELAGTRVHGILPDREEEGTSGIAYGLADGVFLDTPVLTADGVPLPMDMTLSLVSGRGGSALLITLRDSSERRRRQRELATRNAALKASLSPLVITDGDWTVTYVNPAAVRAWGMPRDEMEGGHVRRLLETGAFNAISQAIMELGVWRGEVRCHTPSGGFRAMASGARACHETGRPICSVFSFVDIERRKELEDRLREMSLRDSMTGLYNRRGFFTLGEQVLREARRKSSRVGVLFVDLDGLKEINDRQGHAAGDRAILETAGILRDCFRESDVAARLGGDEFAVLFGETGPSQGETARQRLRERLERLNRSGKLSFSLSLSSGFRCAGGGEAVLESLLTEADNAMYEDKRERRAGRGGA